MKFESNTFVSRRILASFSLYYPFIVKLRVAGVLDDTHRRGKHKGHEDRAAPRTRRRATEMALPTSSPYMRPRRARGVPRGGPRGATCDVLSHYPKATRCNSLQRPCYADDTRAPLWNREEISIKAKVKKMDRGREGLSSER